MCKYITNINLTIFCFYFVLDGTAFEFLSMHIERSIKQNLTAIICRKSTKALLLGAITN